MEYTHNFGFQGIIRVMMESKIMMLRQEIFINELKLGRGELIPKQLRLDKYPDSFRFYDPILIILQKFISDFEKTVFLVKRQVNITKLYEESLSYQIMSKIGIQDDKLSHALLRYHLKMNPHDVDYSRSKHCFQLQQGKCIIIESKKEDMKLIDILKRNQNESRDGDLNFLYQKQDKIIAQNKTFITFKSKIT